MLRLALKEFTKFHRQQVVLRERRVGGHSGQDDGSKLLKKYIQITHKKIEDESKYAQMPTVTVHPRLQVQYMSSYMSYCRTSPSHTIAIALPLQLHVSKNM